MFSMIQSSDPNKRNIIKLHGNAYVSPAGYVVGEYHSVFRNLKRDAALRVLAGLFQRGENVSLWWDGAANDIAAHIQIAE